MKPRQLISLLLVFMLLFLSGCKLIKIPNFKKTASTDTTATPGGDETAEPTETPDITPSPTNTPDTKEYTIDDIIALMNSEMYGDPNNFTVITEDKIKETIRAEQMEQNIDTKVTIEFTYQTSDQGDVVMKADIVTISNGTTTQGTAYYVDGYAYESMYGDKYKYVCTEEEFLYMYYSFKDEENEEFDQEIIKSFSVKEEGRFTVIEIIMNNEAFFSSDEFDFDNVEELNTSIKIYLNTPDNIEAVESIITGKGTQEYDEIEYSIEFKANLKATIKDFKSIQLPDDLDIYEEVFFEEDPDYI